MTGPADADPAFADLFDDLLQRLREGSEPDLEAVRAALPAMPLRVHEAYAMAAAVAGRRRAGDTEPRRLSGAANSAVAAWARSTSPATRPAIARWR